MVLLMGVESQQGGGELVVGFYEGLGVFGGRGVGCGCG